jgi:integrase
MQLFRQTLDYIAKNEAHIKASNGHVFFKDCSSANNLPYLKVDYVRNRFRYYVRLSGIDQVYDISDESYQDHAPRRLHRLTTHSLRHYAITNFSKQTNGNVVLTSRFARHSDPSTTMTYINTKKEELYKEIDSTSLTNTVEQVKQRIIASLK